MKKKVFYDATFQILAPHRGMAVYLNRFLSALELDRHNITGLAPAGLSRKKQRNTIFFGFRNILLWEQFSLSKFINKHRASFFIFPYNTGPAFKSINCNSVLILHDLIFMEPFSKIPLSKNLKQIVGRFYRRIIVPRMVRNSSHIITVSNFSKQEIVKNFGVDDQKISVIPNCIDIKNSSENTSLHLRSHFLNVGGDSPHKNTFFLINSYAKLPDEIRKRYPLRIVGITNPSVRAGLLLLIKSLKQEKSIFVENFQTPQELEQLYLNAFLFIFPSLKEGFGIPLLEAMSYGCTIVCGNTSSMPEVCGEAAFYFDPVSEKSFVDAVCAACNNTALRVRKKEASLERINYYSTNNFNKKVRNWFNSNIA